MLTHTEAAPQATEVPAANKPVLAFFWSAKDGPSRRMDSVVDLLGRARRAHLRLTKVEVAERPDLAERCGIVHAPTVVVLESGREVGRLEGRHSLPQLERFIDSVVASEAPPLPQL